MRNPGRFAIRFALLALLGACSNSSTAPGSFPPIGSLGAIAVTPQNGSIEVEPDATVRITFATLLVAIPHDAIRFEDGGTRLAGNYFADEQSNAIKWRPEHEFRRGATIEVRVATDTGYQTITAFVVREANSILTTSIPGTFGSRTMAFAGGRRLVITGGATFEVVGATVTQLPVVIPPAAFAYGDQHIGFTAPETALLPTEYVRRDLSGNEQRISLPVAQPIGAHNERGDVAMFVTNDRGTPNDWGAWRLLANEFSWQWLGSLALPHQPHLGIDAAGNVVAAYTQHGLIQISQFNAQMLVPTTQQIAMPVGTAETVFDLAADGTGAFAWRDSQFHVVRYMPGSALVELPVPLPTPNSELLLPLTTSHILTSVKAVPGGHAILFSNYTQTGFEFWQQGSMMQRILPNDAVLPAELTQGTPLFATTIRSSSAPTARGEVWSLVRDANNGASGLAFGFQLERNAPGGSFAPLVQMAQFFLPGTQVQSQFWSVDNSGRAILVFNEVGNQDCRVVVID